MSAEVDALRGAAYGERSEEQTNRRNGYRLGDFDTRAGTMDGAMPKLRESSGVSQWPLKRRTRAQLAK